MKLIRDITTNFWHALLDMSPYLLPGFLMTGVMNGLISLKFIERYIGGHGFWPISAFGVPLPMCLCSSIWRQISHIAGLRRCK